MEFLGWAKLLAFPLLLTAVVLLLRRGHIDDRPERKPRPKPKDQTHE